MASMFDGSDDEDVDGKPKVTEKDLNDERDVNVVDSKVTGDWAGWRRDQPSSPHAPGPPALPNRPSGPRPAPPEHPSRSSIPLTQTASPLPQPKSPMLEQARTFLQSPSIATAPSFLTGGAAFLASHADDPVIKWARKHSDNPLGASKTWIVEHFQFGICMFDPSGLKERYARLVAWDGHWVNYWTQTVPTEIFKRAREREGILDAGLIIPQAPEQSQIDELADNDAALLHTGFSGLKGLSSVTSSSSDQSFHTTVEEPSSSLTKEDNKAQERERKTAEKLKKARQKAKEKEQKRAKKEAERAQKKQEDAIKAKQKAMEKVEKMRTELPTPRHFITLPTGLGAVLGGGERWEKVDIAGVDDEVAAHTGLFIRHQNYDYDGLVLCVAERVRLWCKDL